VSRSGHPARAFAEEKRLQFLFSQKTAKQIEEPQKRTSADFADFCEKTIHFSQELAEERGGGFIVDPGNQRLFAPFCEKNDQRYISEDRKDTQSA